MADCDILTEHLRWMGDTRFIYGTIKGSKMVSSLNKDFLDNVIVLALKPCPVKIQIKVAGSDKLRMADLANESRQRLSSGGTFSQSLEEEATENDSTELPSLKHSFDDNNGWITFDKGPVLYLYAGKGPFVSRSISKTGLSFDPSNESSP